MAGLAYDWFGGRHTASWQQRLERIHRQHWTPLAEQPTASLLNRMISSPACCPGFGRNTEAR